MTALDLFNGIGGFSLAFERHGFRTVAFSEVEPFCCRVIAARFPGVPNLGDVRHVNGRDVVARFGGIDVIVGGFPCIDLSRNGNRSARRGLKGEHSGLWSEYARLVREIRPRFVVVENVPALLDGGLGTVLGDLAACGYDAQWDCIPAAAVGAPHRRDRLWLVAHANGGALGAQPHLEPERPRLMPSRRHDAARLGLAHDRAREAEAVFRRVDDGPAERVDAGRRLKALGNSIVPQVAELFAAFIAEQMQVAA